MSAFSISTETVDDAVAIVAVHGYLDFDAAPALKQSLVGCIQAGTGHLVVDLAETGFIDSTAIGVLVGATKRLQESGGSLVVRE
jgi:anti-sigma B factor antagonist